MVSSVIVVSDENCGRKLHALTTIFQISGRSFSKISHPMKHTLTFLIFLSLANGLFSQVMGNYGVEKQKRQNQEMNANEIMQQAQSNVYFQSRGVPKTAVLKNDNTLEISINALSNQKAESYTAIFGILQTGKTAEETNGLLNQRLDAFATELKGLGVNPTDIYIDMVNFLPKYEYDVSKKIFSKKTYTEIPKGFELQKNVHIRYRDNALLDKIVTAAARQEIFDIVKVDYFVSNSQKIYSQLRETAFQYLAEIKKQYRSIGIQLDSAYLITAENAWVAYPINRYESYQAFSAQSLDQGEKQSSIINAADKPVARFYNAVQADDYDIVINPEILEPAVQYSYNLLLRFTLPERKPAVRVEMKKEFVLVTPTGEVKTLKIE
jgi:uncharacterized protein YggE